MSEETSDPTSPDAFSPTEAGEEPGFSTSFEETAREQSSASFAVDVARLWVREHQKPAMLGAFAVGVFVGALLRD